MTNKIDSLKYAVFNEYSYDPPAGAVVIYYDARGTDYKDLLWPVSETYDHISSMIFDDGAEEFEKVYNSVKATKESIENYSWENGGFGCGCDFVAEGKEIAKTAACFYQNELADCFENEEDDERAKKERIIKDAVDNPENYDAVIALLDMVSDAIDCKNDSMF